MQFLFNLIVANLDECPEEVEEDQNDRSEASEKINCRQKGGGLPIDFRDSNALRNGDDHKAPHCELADELRVLHLRAPIEVKQQILERCERLVIGLTQRRNDGGEGHEGDKDIYQFAENFDSQFRVALSPEFVRGKLQRSELLC